MIKKIAVRGSHNFEATGARGQKDEEYGIVTATVLNVRKGAGLEYPIIGQVKKGDKVNLDCKVGDWYLTYYGEHGGFMYTSYLKT